MAVGALAVRHEPASAARIRSAIAADLEQRAVAAGAVDDVILVASELVGNAILHTSADDDLDVSWDVESDCVTITVRDDSDAEPLLRRANETDTHGRGLTIVAALSADWGVAHTGRGKRVWAQIPLPGDGGSSMVESAV
jgi:two-component sensor histidine kinase